MTKNTMGRGAAITAAAVAAVAGLYFIYGKQDAKTKRKIKSWGLRAKAEVLEKLERMKEVTEESYAALIDQVTDKYERVKNVDTNELHAMAADMKKHWKAIEKSLQKKK